MRLPFLNQPHPLRLACLCLSLASPWAHAQSGFTVNTLTGMIYANSSAMDERLDNNDVVYGNLPKFSLVGYIVGYYGGPGSSEVPRSAKWPVSSAATVPAVLRFPATTLMSTYAVSDDGVWQGLVSYTDSSSSRSKGNTITAAPSVNRTLNGLRYTARFTDINNLGQGVGTQYESNKDQSYYWAANQGVRLDCGGCYSSAPLTINNQGVIGGWIMPLDAQGAPTLGTVPAVWRNGAVSWQGDTAVFGKWAEGVAMNDAGTLVVNGMGSRSYTVSASGTVLSLSPQASRVEAHDINAAGVVVGSVDGRAVLWINGQQIDLAAYLASKGVSVANTWRWLTAYDINDKGSMLVQYRLPTDSDTTVRKARLTARP